jgi:para-nitrobenzyl esterase
MKTFFKLTIALFGFYMASCSSDHPVTLVTVEGGKVEGVVKDSITVFKGIPFAQAPVGDLRWKAPQPVKKWDGVLKAFEFGPACPQIQMNYPGMKQIETSEDCLYLNVWTPAKSSKERLPVMVWIYGGGFALGSTSAPVYSGEQLAKLGVIYVSIAYRVGPLGFMAHPELSAESPDKVSGNYDLLDQIQGLKWVQNNIRAFGGDPEKVTIFGESAGAEAVSMLAASPLAKGLFRAAISESGGSFGPVKMNREADCMQLMKGAEQLGVEFMKRMGASSIAELRKMMPDKWLNDPMSQMAGFWPVVDGYVIMGDQYKLYEEEKYNHVNVIIGTNSDEGSLFARPIAAEEYVKSAEKRFGPLSEKILKLYPVDSLTGTYRPLADIFRDAIFAWPSWSWARLQAKAGKSKVFMYYFDQFRPESMYPGSPIPVGAAHASELAYVFRHLEQNPAIKATDEEKRLSDIISRYWTNFAKTGDPNGEGLPAWPQFDENKATVMYLKGTPHTINVPNIEKLKAMDEYLLWKRSSE